VNLWHTRVTAGRVSIFSTGPETVFNPPRWPLNLIHIRTQVMVLFAVNGQGFFKAISETTPLSGGKNVLQYVFWGSKEVIPCRTNAAGDPSPTYDDNRHGAGGELEEWSYTTGDDVNSSPAVGSDGTIYVGSNDDNFMQ